MKGRSIRQDFFWVGRDKISCLTSSGVMALKKKKRIKWFQFTEVSFFSSLLARILPTFAKCLFMIFGNREGLFDCYCLGLSTSLTLHFFPLVISLFVYRISPFQTKTAARELENCTHLNQVFQWIKHNWTNFSCQRTFNLGSDFCLRAEPVKRLKQSEKRNQNYISSLWGNN